jgi:hypothetical protein
MLQVFCPVEVLADQSAFVEGTMAAFHCAITPGRMAWDQAVFNAQADPPQGQEGRKGSGVSVHKDRGAVSLDTIWKPPFGESDSAILLNLGAGQLDDGL